jgi:hypothetical protein
MREEYLSTNGMHNLLRTDKEKHMLTIKEAREHRAPAHGRAPMAHQARGQQPEQRRSAARRVQARRRAIRVVALHEIDEQLTVDGVRRREPHLIDSGGNWRPILKSVEDHAG